MEQPDRGSWPLAFATLGIVFGDIGTSPIYAFRESFEHSELEVTVATAYGVASTVFWALVIVISLKYLLLVMRADNHGEGGILALTSLVIPASGAPPTKIGAAIVTLGVFGTALLYGDGVITPALSVLSAVEGFEVATSAFADWVIPVSVAILVALFAIQRHGTERIAKVFSPIMVVWFTILGLLGLRQIINHPAVLRAVSPTYAIDLFIEHPWRAFLALGSIFLVVTGGEALYADMGHFGRRAIQLSWYSLVLPSLLLTYFGQAALLADGATEVGNPFYDMAPRWGVAPLAVLATMATVIASQALISGAFSLTAQAVRLDYLPRLAVRHTSPDQAGQVYVPLVNWLLMLGCVTLVVTFRSSSALAAAYGVAVTMTMAITTLIFYRVVRDRWGWSAPTALAVLTPFLIVDLGFLAANVPKIPSGGWVALAIGFLLVIQMTTWRRGRQLVSARIRRTDPTVSDVMADVARLGATRVTGTAVYLSREPSVVPRAMIANVRHNKSLHEHVLIVNVEVDDRPHVAIRKRGRVTHFDDGISQVRVHFGFMDEPNVPAVLNGLGALGTEFDANDVTYYLGRESVTAGKVPGMHPWREELFVILNRGAANAARFFHLPADQVLEISMQVEI